MLKHTKLAGYLLFAVTVTGIFLYFCFPSEAARQYLEDSADRVLPAFSLKISRVRPALPLGLKLEQIDLALKDQPGIVLSRPTVSC